MAAASKRLALVTGATAGIGLHTAIGLARAGFRVTIVGRDAGRTAGAARTIAAAAGGAQIGTALADFADLTAVRRLAADILATEPRIDVLVNNAGLIAPHFALSQDGYEMTVAVNHLAPFLMTNLLLNRLKESAPARIVTVASRAHRRERVDPAELARPHNWTPLGVYGRSKLCNILFTRALARRLDVRTLTASCLHPGVIATDIGNRAGTLAGLGWRLVRPFLPGPEAGAATSLFLATVTDPTPYHGAYVVGRAVVQPDAAALDDALGEEVWEQSARLVGIDAP